MRYEYRGRFNRPLFSVSAGHPMDIALLRGGGIILFIARTRPAEKSKNSSIHRAKLGSGPLFQPADV
jgi:hypothetical protein